MLTLVGIIVVIVAVVGGYILEHGNMHVLFQPIEVFIIFGAATGALIISSPGKVIKLVMHGFSQIFSSKHISKADYLELMLMLNAMFLKIKKEGLIAIDSDIENYNESPLFQQFPNMIKDKQAMDFICDNIRLIMTINMHHHELEAMMDIDIEANHNESMLPVHSITRIADSLPGLGIVAAVLGVVITMGKISEPPEVLGHSIGAALVGTFLGVLACYGFVGPMATNLEHRAKDRETYFNMIKMSILTAHTTGYLPQWALEAGRRVIPGDLRPSFSEVENALQTWKKKS
jgi:chemotaxis protein MotA